MSSSRRRYVLIALLAALATILGACSTSAEPTVDADIVVSWDGSSCRCTGPTVLEEGGVTVHYANETEDKINFGITWMRLESSFNAEIVHIPEGGERVEGIRFGYGSRQAGWLRATPNQTHTELLVLDPGWYIVDCFRVEPGETLPSHVWRATSFQVAAGGV